MADATADISTQPQPADAAPAAADEELILVDPDDLTLGEVEDFEQASGTSIANVLAGEVSARALIALVWVMKRRDNPAFTMDDARKIRFGQFGKTTAPDPTNAADA